MERPVDFGEGQATLSATIETVGVVNPDGSFAIVKRGDDGVLRGWPVDQNTIEAVYTESGREPFVMRETLVRE